MSDTITPQIKELNMEWQQFIVDNRLDILILSDDETVQWLSNLHFGMPNVLVEWIDTKLNFDTLLQGWEITCHYQGANLKGKPSSFKLGIYEMCDGDDENEADISISEWIIDGGWDGNSYLLLGYNIADYFYEIGISDEQYEVIKKMFNDFELTRKIEGILVKDNEIQ